MSDESPIKVHPQAAGAQGGNRERGRTKGDSTPRYIRTWMRMLCRSECYYSKFRGKSSQACSLIEGIDAESLLADNGYDSDALIPSITLE